MSATATARQPAVSGTPLTGRLDRLLGRVTMYRLVTVVLAVIAGYAMLLGALGVLFYSPLDMAITLAVAVAATLGTSLLAGLVARVKVQPESSVITGLILFLLFWPSTDATDLVAVAAAGALAGLSKFVLAWRGRHLANPAAVGAVLVTVSASARRSGGSRPAPCCRSSRSVHCWCCTGRDGSGLRCGSWSRRSCSA